MIDVIVMRAPLDAGKTAAGKFLVRSFSHVPSPGIIDHSVLSRRAGDSMHRQLSHSDFVAKTS
jgi:hypothetical protein